MNLKNRFFLLALLLLLIAAVAACSDDENKNGNGGGKGKDGGKGYAAGVCPASSKKLPMPDDLTPEGFARTRYEYCMRSIECKLEGYSSKTAEDCEKEKKLAFETFPTQEHIEELKTSCAAISFYCTYYKTAVLTCDYQVERTGTMPTDADFQKGLDAVQCALDCTNASSCNEKEEDKPENYKYDFPIETSPGEGITEAKAKELMYKVCDKAAECGVEDVVPTKYDSKTCKQLMDDQIADAKTSFPKCRSGNNANYMGLCYEYCAGAYDCSQIQRQYAWEKYHKMTMAQTYKMKACTDSCMKALDCSN